MLVNLNLNWHSTKQWVNEAKSVAGNLLVAIVAICCPSKRASLEQFGH